MVAPESDASSDKDNEVNDSEEAIGMDDTEWCMFLNPDSNTATERKEEVDDTGDIIKLPVSGLHWEVNVDLHEEPANKMPQKVKTIKRGYKHLFKSLIDSMMAMMPIKLWEVIVEEVNRYAEQKKLKKN